MEFEGIKKVLVGTEKRRRKVLGWVGLTGVRTETKKMYYTWVMWRVSSLIPY